MKTTVKAAFGPYEVSGETIDRRGYYAVIRLDGDAGALAAGAAYAQMLEDRGETTQALYLRNLVDILTSELPGES